MSTVALIAVAVSGIALLLVLVAVVKLEAFVSLILTSMVVALLAGIPLTEIIGAIEDGMGGTLGAIAIVIGFGSMFGEMLRISGGTRQLATTLVDSFGEQWAPWAMGLTGFLVSISVFFDVGLIVLLPLAYSLTQRSGRSLLRTLDVFLDLSRLALPDSASATSAVAPRAITETLEAEVDAAAAELGGPEHRVRLSVALPEAPRLVDLRLLGALAHRLAFAAAERAADGAMPTLDVTVDGHDLVFQVADAPERLVAWAASEDSLDAAFVRHAVVSLGGAVRTQPGMVRVEVPCRLAPMVELGALGDGFQGESPELLPAG